MRGGACKWAADHGRRAEEPGGAGRLTEEKRRASRWTALVEVAGRDGRIARGVVQGPDMYGMTAVIAVEGARRLLEKGAPRGVLAPAQVFEAADFLDALAVHGVRWSVEIG